MTRCTLLGSGLVKEHLFGLDCLHQLVTAVATYIAMHALQWESRALVVIEQRRLPLHAVVAIRAWGYLVRSTGKLRTVNILMAFFALTRCRTEVGVRQLSAHVWRLVTVNARHRPVRTD